MNGEIEPAQTGGKNRTSKTNAPARQSVSTSAIAASSGKEDGSVRPIEHKSASKDAAFLQERKDTSLAFAQAVIPEWLNIVAMVSLIFGGCCTNVFALEAIIRAAPRSGTLITCFQFLITALFTLPSQLDLSRGPRHFFLKPRAIPIKKWIIYTAFFLAINILNNKAFSYKISVPLHIILRSAGPVATMAVGYISGKRYTRIQVAAVSLLFSGVVQAAISDAMAKGKRVDLMAAGSGSSTSEFLIGFGLLYLALILSAIMGIFTDRMYTSYGRSHANENLFYSHALSLPFFFSFLGDLKNQSQGLFLSPPMSTWMQSSGSPEGPSWLHALMERVPTQALFLLMNAMTQFLCIKGVNQLSARSSSLTVTIVLNIRKLVSLMLSIVLFGNALPTGVLVGAGIVFLGGGLYAWPTQNRRAKTAMNGQLKKGL